MADAWRRDIVVPCTSGRHKVRLAGGLRFLASARCPKCRAPVDPTRGHRLLQLLSNLRRPASARTIDRVVWASSPAALVLSAVGAVTFWRLADQWWPATMLLFGPRWLLLLPIPFLILLAAVRDRVLLIPLLVSAWLIVGPIMGFRTGWRALLTSPDPLHDLRVVTFNARDGESLTRSPEQLVAEWGAEVVGFEECGGGLRGRLEEMDAWHVWSRRGVCLLSRFPILETDIMPADAIQAAGGSGIVSSHLLEGEAGPFWITIVHLGTPRAGLQMIRRGSIAEGIRVLRRDSYLREIEHRQAARFAAERTGPHIVLGDFNAPPESRIYRAEWEGWTNAFSRVGHGIGGTRLNGWIRARIDHVLVDDSWEVVDARVGTDVGSDHLPMIATVRRR